MARASNNPDTSLARCETVSDREGDGAGKSDRATPEGRCAMSDLMRARKRVSPCAKGKSTMERGQRARTIYPKYKGSSKRGNYKERAE